MSKKLMTGVFALALVGAGTIMPSTAFAERKADVDDELQKQATALGL